MDLSYRPTRLTDLQACLPLICDGFAFAPEEHAALLDLWGHLIREQMCESSVVEDRDGPPGRQIVGFGMSAFVTEDVLTGDSSSPLLAKSLLAAWHQGKRPFLDRRQIGRANAAGGLNSVILHSGWLNAGADNGHVLRIRRCLLDALIEHHRGYSVKSLLIEVYGAEEFGRACAIGWRLKSAASTADAEGGERWLPGREPFLLSLGREEVRENAYHLLYPIFNHTPPRFFFRPSQQALLKLALIGTSDAGCAEEMEVTLSTVQKRWRAIYERVHDTDAVLLGPPGELKRGAEKRTALLRYLQAHPEELRSLA